MPDLAYSPGSQSILICTPYRASTHPALIARWRMHAAREVARHPEQQIDTCLLADFSAAQPGDGRYSAHARARNALLESVALGAYDYLYWVDVDLIAWPDGLLAWALAHNPDGVSAPAVTLQYHQRRFYDILGYIEEGLPARLYPPWFDQPGPIVELESVGCCYVIPAAIYRDGARYDHTPGYTEHEAVMRVVRGQGRRICTNLDIRAVHAWLPDYGEGLH